MITLANHSLELDLDPSRGAAIRRLAPVGGPNVLAQRTWELPRPTWEVGTYGDSSADLHADYDLSWRQQFPNSGAACEYAGTPLPFHGDAWSGEWKVVAREAEAVELEFTGRLPLLLRRSMRLDGPSVLIEESVTNLCPVPLDFVWGHHPVVPATPGARLDLPGGRVRAEPTSAGSYPDLRPGSISHWPVGIGTEGPVDLRVIPEGPVSRMLIIDELVDGWAAVRDPGRGLGLALAWDVSALPRLWLWLEVGGRGFPWFGRACALGVEPQSSGEVRGLAAAVENGQALRLGPGGRQTSWITATVLTDVGAAVVGVGRDGSCAFGSGA